jgi:hypothetical protein
MTRSAAMMKWFPLLLIAVVLYNVLAFTAPWLTGTTMDAVLSRSLDMRMFSGDVWHFTTGDLIVLLTLILLFVEVLKSTGTGSVSVLNHGLSMATFAVALIEFMVVRGFSTSTFFLIVAMTLFDVVAGFTVSIVAAKRDLGATGGLIGTS